MLLVQIKASASPYLSLQKVLVEILSLIIKKAKDDTFK